MTDLFGSTVAVMNRKAVEYWGGIKAPPELAFVHIDHAHRRRIVTWGDVMTARRERQRRRLELKRHVERRRAYKLWVAYFDQELMGGWHAFLEDYRGDPYRIWVRADWLREALMEAFPLVVGGDQWQRWKAAFAECFERRRQGRRPLGVAYVWWDGRDTPRPIVSQRRAAVSRDDPKLADPAQSSSSISHPPGGAK